MIFYRGHTIESTGTAYCVTVAGKWWCCKTLEVAEKAIDDYWFIQDAGSNWISLVGAEML